MQGSLKLITAPTVEPVDLTQALLHLRITNNEEHALVINLIKAARRWCEDFAGLSFVNTTWDYSLPDFPGGDGVIVLPRPPLVSVTHIQYVDANGTTQALAASTDYTVNTYSEPGEIWPAYGTAWPGVRDVPGALVVRFIAGFGSAAADVPENARQAVLLMIGHFYENREAVLAGTISKEIEFGVKSLLWPLRSPEVLV